MHPFPQLTSAARMGCLLALACGGLPGADFPVGTVAQFQAAVTAAKPGDTITLTNRVWADADLLFKGQGTAAQPITLRAQSPGHVVLAGRSRLRIAGNWLIVEGLRFQNGWYTNSDVIQFRENTASLATNCVLRHCAIVGYNPPDPAVDNKWVSLYGVSNRVEHCWFQGKTNAGATLVVWLSAGQTNLANHHVIRRNYFGPRPPLGVNGGETIRVGDSSTSFQNSRTRVEENLFRACNGEMEIISNKSCENLYRFNTFDACEGTLTLRHGNRCTVEGNWFFGRGMSLTGGVRIIGEDHQVFNNYFEALTGTGLRSAICFVNGVPDSALNEYFQVKRARVLFNTVVQCVRPVTVGQTVTGGTLAPVDCTFANNLVVGSNAPLISIVTAPTNFVWEGNLVFGAAVGLAHPGIRNVNPLLHWAADHLWRPSPASPARDAAEGDYPWITEDVDGQSRSAAWDVGCDEISDAPIIRRPLQLDDVGPDWLRQVGPLRVLIPGQGAPVVEWTAIPLVLHGIELSANLTTWVVAHSFVPTVATGIWVDDGNHPGGVPNLDTPRFYRLVAWP